MYGPSLEAMQSTSQPLGVMSASPQPFGGLAVAPAPLAPPEPFPLNLCQVLAELFRLLRGEARADRRDQGIQVWLHLFADVGVEGLAQLHRAALAPVAFDCGGPLLRCLGRHQATS